MKRLIAIFFLNLVVLNTIGYYGLFLLIERQLATPVLQKIESNPYETGGNLIFSIPLEMPYAPDSEQYTEMSGEIVFKEEVYRLVRQKFHHNVLYIVCIKDEESTRSKAALADYSRLFSGHEAESTDSNIKVMNSLSKFYTSTDVPFNVEKAGWSFTVPFSMGIKNLYQLELNASIFNPPRQS